MKAERERQVDDRINPNFRRGLINGLQMAFWFWIAVICLCLLLSGCSGWLPMTGDLKSSISDAEVKRISSVTHLSEDKVRDPVIHEVHEVSLSCWQMLQECYPSVKWYLKALGSIPLACTKIIQQPWNEKVAIIYSCWLTAPFSMDHERKHAKGEMHAYW
jgi:hypothetical protein